MNEGVFTVFVTMRNCALGIILEVKPYYLF